MFKKAAEEPLRGATRVAQDCDIKVPENEVSPAGMLTTAAPEQPVPGLDDVLNFMDKIRSDMQVLVDRLHMVNQRVHGRPEPVDPMPPIQEYGGKIGELIACAEHFEHLTKTANTQLNLLEKT